MPASSSASRLAASIGVSHIFATSGNALPHTIIGQQKTRIRLDLRLFASRAKRGPGRAPSSSSRLFGMSPWITAVMGVGAASRGWFQDKLSCAKRDILPVAVADTHSSYVHANGCGWAHVDGSCPAASASSSSRRLSAAAYLVVRPLVVLRADKRISPVPDKPDCREPKRVGATNIARQIVPDHDHVTIVVPRNTQARPAHAGYIRRVRLLDAQMVRVWRRASNAFSA